MARFAARDRLGSARRRQWRRRCSKLGIAVIRSSTFLRAEFAGTNSKRRTAFVASSGDRVILERDRTMRAAAQRRLAAAPTVVAEAAAVRRSRKQALRNRAA